MTEFTPIDQITDDDAAIASLVALDLFPTKESKIDAALHLARKYGERPVLLLLARIKKDSLDHFNKGSSDHPGGLNDLLKGDE